MISFNFVVNKYSHALRLLLLKITRPTLPPLYRALYSLNSSVEGNEDHTNEVNEGGYTPASMGRSAHHSEQASPSTHVIFDENTAGATTSLNQGSY